MALLRFRLTALQDHKLYDLLTDNVAASTGVANGACQYSYYLYSGICSIRSPVGSSPPATINVSYVAQTTRVVCEQLCSGTYDLDCSGFMYSRDDKACTSGHNDNLVFSEPLAVLH